VIRQTVVIKVLLAETPVTSHRSRRGFGSVGEAMGSLRNLAGGSASPGRDASPGEQ
jgi:hypothetical protein